MPMILHVLRFLRVGLIIIKDSHLNFDMKYQKISGNTGPYNQLTDRKYSSMKQFVLLSVVAFVTLVAFSSIASAGLHSDPT